MDNQRLIDTIKVLDVLVVQADDQAQEWTKKKEEAESKAKFWSMRRDILKRARLQVDQIHDDKLIERKFKADGTPRSD